MHPLVQLLLHHQAQGYPKVGVIGCNGAFGKLIRDVARDVAPFIDIIGYDIVGPSTATFEEAAGCDIVFLAVPIRNFEELLTQALPHIRQDALIVDICTVKMHTVALLRKFAQGLNWIAMHPLFGPQSYSANGNSLRGLEIVVCEHHLQGSITREYVLDFLEAQGLRLIEMTARLHDFNSAWTLYMAHRTSQIWKAAGVKATLIDTPSFALMLRGAEMVANDTELFKDVREFNSYCRYVDMALARAEAEVLHSGK